jgi:hypothetical protein
VAIVKIKFNQSADKTKGYHFRNMDPEHIVNSNLCSFETAEKEFKDIQSIHGKNGKNEAIHVIQSWNEQESGLKSREEFNLIGMQLAESYFKGHQYYVVTHHETGKVHNHIVINPVHMESGKRVHNKKHHLGKLRKESDNLCRENGLSVLERTTDTRKDKMPPKVKRIVERGGQSWIMDIREKSRQASEIATSFDEYRYTMDLLGIKVRIEDKNISYMYPGRDKAKRGKTLGKQYDKDGLMEKFKDNDLRFAVDPMTRKILEEKLKRTNAKTASVNGTKGSKQYSSVDEWFQDKDYSAFTKIRRRDINSGNISLDELKRGPFPSGAIEKAKQVNISDYCKKNHIGLFEQEGKTTVKGRPYVEIEGGQWFNQKNKTEGNTIDFVRIHQNVSTIKAISILNDDKKILAFDKFLAVKRPNFQSFYIPKESQANSKFATEQISEWLKSVGANSKSAGRLSGHKQLQVHKDGRIRFLSEVGSDGYVDYQERGGKWHKKSGGSSEKPFMSFKGNSDKMILFSDIGSFTKAKGGLFDRESKRKHSMFALLDGNEQAVDKFIGENRGISEIFVVASGNKGMSQSELKLFESLKSRYSQMDLRISKIPLSIAMERKSPEREFLGL